MFEFNIVESVESGERAYYVNGVRFDREIWRACMESELKTLNLALAVQRSAIEAFDLAIKGAQKHMDGKASFELPSNARAFYRQVMSEIRAHKRENQAILDEIIACIEDYTDKLED